MLKEFFGFGGYMREPEGWFSWQHITFVTSLMVVMVALAIIFGLKNKTKSDKEKNNVLVWAAILIDVIEIFKIIMMCIRGKDPMAWQHDLPLFMCSIQLITIPLAAFSKGRIREASMDFVFIFGILGAVMGTYMAGQNYGTYPVLSFDNVVSGVTHSISGFTSLYIGIAGLTKLQKNNMIISFVIITSFAIAAYIVNMIIGYNYMFLMAGDGTPYDIIYNLFNGHKVLYPVSVVVLFYLYIAAFYGVHHIVRHRLSKH